MERLILPYKSGLFPVVQHHDKHISKHKWSCRCKDGHYLFFVVLLRLTWPFLCSLQPLGSEWRKTTKSDKIVYKDEEAKTTTAYTEDRTLCFIDYLLQAQSVLRSYIMVHLDRQWQVRKRAKYCKTVLLKNLYAAQLDRFNSKSSYPFLAKKKIFICWNIHRNSETTIIMT